MNAKQDNLVIGASSGLLMDTDGKTLTVKADDSTLEVTSAGVKIKNSGVGSAQIADGSITGADIATQTITGNNLVNNTITATQIASNTITANEIAQNAITADELANDAVDTGAIQAGAVTLAKLNADVSTSTATNGDSRLMTSDGVFDITNVDTAGNYLQTGTNVAANLGKLDTAIGAKIAADGNVIKKSDTNSVNANISALDTAIGDMSDFATDNEFAVYSTVAQNLSALDSQLDTVTDVLGDAETGTAPTTGLLQELIGTDHTVIEDLRTVANNAAGKALDNTFTGANEFQGASTFKGATTFKNDNGFTVTDSTDSTSATFGVKTVDFTDLEDTTSSNKILKVDVEDAMLVDGTLASTNGLSIVKETGTNKYTEVMAIDSNGNIETTGTLSAADGAFTVDGSGNTKVSSSATSYVKLNADGSLETTGSATVGNGLTVSAGGANITGNSTVKGTFGAGTNGTEFTVSGTGDVKAASLTFNGTDKVNAIDTGTAAITDGAGNAQTMATTATVGKTVGNFANLTNGAITAKTDVTTAINSLAANVETATGGTFTAGVWAATVNNAKTAKAEYNYVESNDLMDAINQVATNVGTKAQLNELYNGVANDKTVNQNITAVNKTVGDITKLNGELKNLTNGTTTLPKTVVEALNNLDATLGTIHGLSTKLAENYKGNLAEGTTVEQHLTAIDASIGDRRLYNNTAGSNGYTATAGADVASAVTEIASNIGTAADLGVNQNGVNAGNTVNANIASLNEALGDVSTLNTTHYASTATNVTDAVKAVDQGLYSLDQDVRSLRHHFEGGMASAAALSALQPNARATGNTQLALGTGAYKGHTAMALGGFHWVTDNLFLNAGVAWDNREATYRMGVTYSW